MLDPLRLLTRVYYRDPQGDLRECLACVIALGSRAARVESARPLDKGVAVSLLVVFPGQREYAERHVKLDYLVRGPFDEENLQYDLDAVQINGEARQRLHLFLQRERDRRS
jgi:hypothetical protein